VVYLDKKGIKLDLKALIADVVNKAYIKGKKEKGTGPTALYKSDSNSKNKNKDEKKDRDKGEGSGAKYPEY
jgi:hypothetical protein